MKNLRSIITLVALSSLSACSQIKSLFPDKEKEYQYTVELPRLIYPADLQVNVVPVLPKTMTHAEPVNTAAITATNDLIKSTAAVTNSSTNASASHSSTSPIVDKAYNNNDEEEEELAAKLITVERINVDKGENRLRLNVPYLRAWRILGKSLSRKALEVMVRNQEAGFFTLKYDPDERSVKDLSYIDNLKGLLGTLTSNEKTYIIKLEKDQLQTDVTVLDKDQKPVTDADSVKLLTLIQETIKADLMTHK
jgi:outer membrane protein assembly factor BamC